MSYQTQSDAVDQEKIKSKHLSYVKSKYFNQIINLAYRIVSVPVLILGLATVRIRYTALPMLVNRPNEVRKSAKLFLHY
ncbi:hypothetical protein OSCI_1680002 [Kamptonema sp. PCC 6506]|nr:hypothetical protein OSCI_1680002 [Kamptonema sp. PCC 6506]